MYFEKLAQFAKGFSINNIVSKARSKIEFGLFAVLFISIVFAVIYMLGFLRSFENLLVDSIVVLSSKNESKGDYIVYAHTSQRGLKEAERDYNMGWPWRRATYSKLIDFLNRSGARLIVFDSIFSEKSVYSYLGEEDDKSFADTLSKARNVIIGMVFYLKDYELQEKIDLKIKSLEEKPLEDIKGLLKKRIKLLKYLSLLSSESELDKMSKEKTFSLLRGYFNKTIFAKYKKAQKPFLANYSLPVEERDKSNSIANYYRTVPPIKLLQDKTLQVSSVEGPLDIDGKARRTPLLVKYWDKYYPSLSFATIYHYLKPSKVVVEKSRIIVDDRVIPLTREGNLRLKFYGTRHIYPTFYHIDIIKVYDYINELLGFYKKSLGRNDITQDIIYNDYSRVFDLREEVRKSNSKLADKISLSLLKKVNPSAFNKKIVVLGSIAPGMFDQRATPFSQVETGVHIHATAIDNILNNDVLQEIREELLIAILIFVLPWLVYILSSRLSLVSGVLVTVLSIIVIVFLSILLYKEANLLIDVGTMSLVVLFTFPVISIIKYFKESKQKKHIKYVFGQYLSPKVIDAIIDDPNKLQLGGVDREITSFFSDIESFSSLSEHLKATDLVNLLNDYLTEICDIIMSYDGVIDKFEGDAIIAFWGAPLDQVDHARRAVSATIAIQNRMVELRRLWLENGQAELRMRIGINSGLAVVGNMGSKQRMDYTMIGDTVNLAARLEGANKFYNTYSMISEYTYNMVKDIAAVREADKVRVMGKEIPVTIYELLGKIGELDDKTEKLIANHKEGYYYYSNRDFKKAKSIFRSSLLIDKNDGLSLAYVEKCKRFIKKPPASDWDGITNLDKK